MQSLLTIQHSAMLRSVFAVPKRRYSSFLCLCLRLAAQGSPTSQDAVLLMYYPLILS